MSVLMAGAVDAAPARVVSINLCTDQLAMMLAEEGQLLSVSRVALDPRMSPMAEKAERYVVNSSRAEEVQMMRPDLVVAGTYTSRETVAMLRRLGIEVVQFDIVRSLDGVRGHLAKMGAALGREAAARAMIERFDADLARLRASGGSAQPNSGAPRAALYHANGYNSGDASLASDILATAGLRDAPAEAGFGAGKLPLEVLAMMEPDLVITSQRYPGGSRAEEIMDHPVVSRLRGTATSAAISDQDWVCGTPYVLRAVRDMVAARKRLEAGE